MGSRGASSSLNRTTKKIKDILENGQVIDFSIGPTMTIMSLYNGGRFSYNNKNVTSPMKMANEDVVPEIGNEALVVAYEEQINLRKNYFKRNGFEIGETYDNPNNKWEKVFLIKRRKE